MNFTAGNSMGKPVNPTGVNSGRLTRTPRTSGREARPLRRYFSKNLLLHFDPANSPRGQAAGLPTISIQAKIGELRLPLQEGDRHRWSENSLPGGKNRSGAWFAVDKPANGDG